MDLRIHGRGENRSPLREGHWGGASAHLARSIHAAISALQRSGFGPRGSTLSFGRSAEAPASGAMPPFRIFVAALLLGQAEGNPSKGLIPHGRREGEGGGG